MQFQSVYSRRCLAIISLILLGSHLPSSVVAEENQTETLIVTAARNALEPKQVGAAYTVITREEIENRQAVFVSDLLRSVPGFAVSRSGGTGSQTQVRVRGGEANHVLVLIDGVEANDPATGSAFDFAHLTTAGIKRIEIIQGPQSAAWGSDALSGVINIITRTGEGPVRLDAFATMGSHHTQETGLGLRGAYRDFSYALDGSYVDTGGINISEQGSENDGYRNSTLSFRTLFEPTSNFSTNAVVRHTNAKNEFDPVPFTSAIPVDGDRATSIERLYSKLEATSYHFDKQWKNTWQIANTDTNNDNFSDRIRDSSTEGQKFKLSYQSSLSFALPQVADSSHTITVVAEREREEFTQRGTPTMFGDPNQDQNITNYGYVAELQSSFLQQWFFHFAYRHDENSDFKDAQTYRSSISYILPNSQTKLFTSYARGVTNPTFADRFGFFADTFIGNPDLQPEQSREWEVGIEQPFASNRGRLRLSYFRARLKDEINGFFFDPMLLAFTAININGRSKRQGVEANLDAPVTDNIKITASFTYLDASQQEADGDGQTSEIRRPQQQGSLRIDYASTDKKLRLGAGLVFNGKQFDNVFPPFPTPSFRTELDDYTLFDIEGSYRVNDWLTAFVRGENLLNDRYQEVFGFETLGRTVYGGVKVNFSGD